MFGSVVLLESVVQGDGAASVDDEIEVDEAVKCGGFVRVLVLLDDSQREALESGLRDVEVHRESHGGEQRRGAESSEEPERETRGADELGARGEVGPGRTDDARKMSSAGLQRKILELHV